ncbi:MAG: tRNA glutamyl-Q(34) synthetase GluQRS [Planctomycetota bacterium]
MPERPSTQRVTRLAPSPTGTLHLGNALTFMVNWALARRLGWRVILRIEDLDTGRVRGGADQEAIDVLRWLGMDWDEGPLYQSVDLSPYQTALQGLLDQGLIYPCDATRKEIELAASAPHASDQETRYPGLNRPTSGRYVADRDTPGLLAGDSYAWRLIVPDRHIDFTDELQGAYAINVQSQVGDFALATKAGLPAYQLAVVVDDARQGVTDIVRGDDLLDSTPRQALLYRLLGLGEPPRYWHLPLVTGAGGRRMAKRDDAARLTTYRDAGVPGGRVVGLLAKWAGLTQAYEEVSADEFADRLNPDEIGYAPPSFTPEDEQWLMSTHV